MSVLLCIGCYDRLFLPQESQKIATALSNARFRFFLTRHAIVYDCPQKLAREIVGFLQGLNVVAEKWSI